VSKLPQMLLPIFKTGLNHITSILGYEVRGTTVYYFLGQLPLFSHEEKDKESFRYITSQLVVNGHVKQMDIVRAFKVSRNSLKRSVKKLREEGIEGFSAAPKSRGGPSIIVGKKKDKIEALLEEGLSVKTIAKELEIKSDTIKKAIQQGRLKKKRLLK